MSAVWKFVRRHALQGHGRCESPSDERDAEKMQSHPVPGPWEDCRELCKGFWRQTGCDITGSGLSGTFQSLKALSGSLLKCEGRPTNNGSSYSPLLPSFPPFIPLSQFASQRQIHTQKINTLIF